VELDLEEGDREEQPTDQVAPPFKIVALSDLSSPQIEVFATAKGVTDIRRFLEEVERVDAWSFTTRPQDLEELASFWNENKRIGSRLELMRNSIDRRLRERDQTRAEATTLHIDDAHHGVKLLAAAATLSREPTFRVPDGAAGGTGLIVSDVLPSWTESNQKALLSRPIFDEAIYGTVRFHHRAVREYLTAEWLLGLLQSQASRRKIESLLFRRQYDLKVIAPVMRPVLPWLSIFDDRIREKVVRLAPELILTGGDPSQLPLETRRTILHQVCERVAAGASDRSATDYGAVQRFASVDLAEDIRSLLIKYRGNRHLLWFLLRMVWQGELKALLPEAKEVALRKGTERYARIAAFRAVAAVGSASDKADLCDAFIREAKTLNRDLLAELIRAAEPSLQLNRWLLEALNKAEPKRRFSADSLAQAVSDYVERSDLSLIPELVTGLNQLLNKRPVTEQRYCEISKRHGYLMKAAAEAVDSLVRERHPAAFGEASLAVMKKLPAYRQHGEGDHHEIREEFRERVPAWPELNRALFWYEVADLRRVLKRKRQERLTDYWQTTIFGTFCRFDAEDFQKVVLWISQRPLADDRLVALSLAIQLYRDHGRPRPWLARLKKAVSGDPALSARLQAFLHPPQQKVSWRKREAQWKRRDARRRSAEEKNRSEWRRHILANVERLPDPRLKRPNDISRHQWYLFKRMCEKESRSSHWCEGHWRNLIPEFGQDVAEAFREGLVSYWRRNTPRLGSEGAALRNTPFSTTFGLGGLYVEARETPAWPHGLSEEEAELATRYGLMELNGFAPWLKRLHETFPNPWSG
jgi:hypothetical protein